MNLVIDASMAVAWLFDDERTQAAHEVMVKVVTEGAVVPSLWKLEVANVLRNAVKRGRCDTAYVDRSLDRLQRLAITIDDETDIHAWGQTRALSNEEELTPYDASYLELALRLGKPLGTCDCDLILAAKRRGVVVLTA